MSDYNLTCGNLSKMMGEENMICNLKCGTTWTNFSGKPLKCHLLIFIENSTFFMQVKIN